MKLLVSFFLFVIFFTKGWAQNTDSIPKKDSVPSKPKVAPWYTDRFRLSAGFFLPVSSTDIQVGVQGGVNGTPINLEKDLGFGRTSFTFLANFQWRISRRSRLNLNYYNIPRKASHTIDKDITFKDTTFHANATVSTYFNTAIYQISYGYAILSKPNYEVGILIGTHLVGGKAGISLAGEVNTASKSTNFGFTAPLPDLGLWGGFTFSDRLAVNLDIDYLSLTVGDVTGSIFAYNLLFMYRLLPKLDISLGYSGLNFKVDLVKEHATGSFKWGYNGPALGVTYAFGKTSWGH